jgi:two-component system response regulator MprA
LNAIARPQSAHTESSASSIKRVLVVEDEPDTREALELALKAEGYAVDLARDGREAIERIAERQPGVILLDLAMPRMDGLEFAHELERRGLRPGIPIVLVTAVGAADERAREIHAEGYLAKPFELTELLDQIGRLSNGPAAGTPRGSRGEDR